MRQEKHCAKGHSSCAKQDSPVAQTQGLIATIAKLARKGAATISTIYCSYVGLAMSRSRTADLGPGDFEPSLGKPKAWGPISHTDLSSDPDLFWIEENDLF